MLLSGRRIHCSRCKRTVPPPAGCIITEYPTGRTNTNMPRQSVFTDPAILQAALEGLETQKQRIEEQIAEVKTLLGKRPRGRPPKGTKKASQRPGNKAAKAPAGKRRKRSAAARKRMSEAQKKRWAKQRKAAKKTAA